MTDGCTEAYRESKRCLQELGIKTGIDCQVEKPRPVKKKLLEQRSFRKATVNPPLKEQGRPGKLDDSEGPASPL